LRDALAQARVKFLPWPQLYLATSSRTECILNYAI
jgi:hypothetical protein